MNSSRVKISDVAHVKGGKRLPLGTDFANGVTIHPYIRARDIGDGKITFDQPVYIDEDVHAKIKNYVVDAGDVCITIVGANVGDVGQIPANLHRANLTENAVKLIGKEEGYISDFIKYALLTEDAQKQMKNSAAGSAQPKLGIYKINEIEIPYPDYNVRCEVSLILNAYDELIENNNRRIAILENMAQSLYREWFVNFRFPGHENCKFVDSALGRVPEGWGKQFGDIVDYCRESIKKAQLNDEMIYLGLEHMPRKSIAISEWGSASQIASDKCAFQAGDILFGKIRPYFHKVGVALTDGVCSTDIFVWRPKSDEYAAMAAMTAFSDAFVAQATQTSQGTKMPRANWDVLKEYQVFIPSGKILDDFNALAGNAIREIGVLSMKNRNLKEQRDTLLPRLVSGQIELDKQ